MILHSDNKCFMEMCSLHTHLTFTQYFVLIEFKYILYAKPTKDLEIPQWSWKSLNLAKVLFFSPVGQYL